MNDVVAIADDLVRRGTRLAFGVTGSGASFDLIEALEERDVTYIPAGHEAAATMMAGSATSVSGLPVPSVSIKGPGLANAVGGIAANHFEGHPSISLSEAYENSAGSAHKRLDHRSLLTGIVKGHAGIRGGVVDELLELASLEPPGPVHLDLASDAEIGSRQDKGSVVRGDLAGVLRRILDSQRPLLVVGSLAARRKWGTRLRGLRIPVFTTARAKGALDETEPQAAGVLTGAGGPLSPEWALAGQADLLVGIGLREGELIRDSSRPVETILWDEIEDGLMRRPNVTCSYVDPSGKSVTEILATLVDKEWGETELGDVLRDIRARLTSGWGPGVCFEVIAPWSNFDSILDTGTFCTVAEHVYLATQVRRYAGTSNGRFMGTAIPFALGSALASGRPTICVLGDGGMRAYPGELKIALAQDLPLLVILMTDGRYGSVATALGRPRSRSKALTTLLPSWDLAMEAMGFPTRTVETADDFATALNSWDRASPMFVEARFDSDGYERITEGVR